MIISRDLIYENIIRSNIWYSLKIKIDFDFKYSKSLLENWNSSHFHNNNKTTTTKATQQQL